MNPKGPLLQPKDISPMKDCWREGVCRGRRGLEAEDEAEKRERLEGEAGDLERLGVAGWRIGEARGGSWRVWIGWEG